MALDVIFGESRNRALAKDLAARLEAIIESGTVYLGYPVLATADERVEVDALLLSRDHGLVAFLLGDATPSTDEEWHSAADQQDRLYAMLESNLRRHDSLRKG